MPETIGDGSAGTTEFGGDASVDSEALAELMREVAFEPQDVQDTLAEFFDWVAERCKSDHWKLSERQSRMIGVPLSQVLNAVWQELCRSIPGPIARWIENTPGAAKLLIACGIVLTPKIKKQFAINRQRKQESKVQNLRSAAAPSPQPRVAPHVPKVVPVQPIVPSGGVDMFSSAIDGTEGSN